MKSNPLRLADDRTLVEQLKFQWGYVSGGVIPDCVAALMLVLVLTTDRNAVALRIWGGLVILMKLYMARDARIMLASPMPLEQAQRQAWRQVVLHGINGVAWGSLAWIALDGASLAGSTLIAAVVAGAMSSAMPGLSPVLPVYISYLVAFVTTISTKTMVTEEVVFRAFGAFAVLYVFILLGQARNGAKAVRAAIELRFENLALIQQLRVETDHAQAAHQRAEEANLAKSKFLAAASHDLRQPIHAQGLFLEVLARSPLSAAQEEALGNARATLRASAEMLDALLDFSRIEAGVIEPQLQTFPLQPLLNKIERELAPQADAKGMVYRSRETDVAVHSDPTLVALILRNLVSNAIRYTEQGGVLVACRRRGDEVLLEVWDTGIGIDPALHGEIFREFHQLGNAERDRSKGLGLGLAIAQGLARALEHRLSLLSQPGRGSVFRLALPAAQMMAADESACKHTPDPARIKGVRVLVIDDDGAVRAGMRQLLSAWGCQCDVADSIEEAQALARAHPPELIISDYRLREQRTGAQAIATLRSEFGAHLPALLITGDTAPQRIREARTSGVPLLHKPVSPEQLFRGLMGLLNEGPANSASVNRNESALPSHR